MVVGRAGRRWTRRGLLAGVGGIAALGALRCVPLSGPANPPPRVPTIGFLSGSLPDYPAPEGKPRLEEFLDGLHELGYVDRQDFRLEARYAAHDYDALPLLAAELVSLSVDVLVAGDSRAIPAARDATHTIPIVMTVTSEPGRYVASLARPGGNITGLMMAPAETIGKRLELLRDAVPSLSHVALLHNPADPSGASLALPQVAAAAPALDLAYTDLPIRRLDELPEALAWCRAQGVDGLTVWGDAFLNAETSRLAEAAIAAGLPSIGMSREVAERGLLMAYAPDLPSLFRRSAVYVDKILKGASPAELRVERPERLELVINLRTAQALMVELPARLLSQASYVIR
jgi:putative ABC transport system substrate-binding protein